MTPSDGFLDREPEALEAFLLAHARQEVAPSAARERALESVLQVALGAGGLATVAMIGARPSAFKASLWLAGKWLLVGLGGGLATLTAVHAVTRPSPAERAPAAPSVNPPSTRPARLVPNTPLEPSDAAAARVAAPAIAPHPPPSPRESASPLRPNPQNSPDPDGREPSAGASRPGRASDTELVRELALLERARSALGSRAGARALQALDEYGAEFPRGALRAEAAALRVEAVGLGDPAHGSALAASFLRDYASSPLSARVRTLAESYRARLGGAQKP